MKFSPLFILLIVIISSSCTCSVFAGENAIYDLNENIIVTATRTPSSFSDLIRSVTVLHSDEINLAPVQNINDLLSGIAGLDIRQRGACGVQSDITTRGGSFQQTLIMVDGVKVNDPQTGHHSLNLPLILNDIDRVEVLKGPGSGLYGPDAMSGVVNFITKSDVNNKIHIESTAGDFGLFEGSASLSSSRGLLGQNLSISRSQCPGYQKNSEFDIFNISYRANIKSKIGPISLSARYTDREFGAYKFYSDSYPNEWEATEALILSTSAELAFNRTNFSPRLFWRQHKDDFILDRDRPEWYRNRHTTDIYGTEIQITLETEAGITVLGGELAGEEIKSSNLGDHSRTRGGLIFEQLFPRMNRFSASSGFSLYYHSDWGWGFWPSIDVGCQLIKTTKLFISAGKSYRVPSFTDLYYNSPANIGNPELQPEKAWTIESGVKFSHNYLAADFSLFYRDGDDMIDWVRTDTVKPWQVQNVAQFTTSGIELILSSNLRKLWSTSLLTQIKIQYSYLDSKRSAGFYESKYLLDYLKHQILINIDVRYMSKLNQRWSLRHLQRFGNERYTILDSRLIYRPGDIEIFVDVTNIFNTEFIEIGTIQRPGRWFRAGFKFDIGY